MKKRKKLIKIIGALLCALVVAVSSLGVSCVFYANDGALDSLLFCRDDLVHYGSAPSSMPSTYGKKYAQYALLFNPEYSSWDCYLFNADTYSITSYTVTRNGVSCYSYYLNYVSGNGCIYRMSDNVTWEQIGNSDLVPWHISVDNNVIQSGSLLFHSSSVPIVFNDTVIFNGNEGFNDPMGKYNPTLGYLKNVSRKSTYIRDALYNYDNDSLTYHWYHDLQSTSGVDLTSGGYKIRHYVSNATVKGYEKEDIVEMSEKYLMAEYDASLGYFSYLDKDYDDKLENLGYELPGFIDTVFKGYFVLQHHYFQIVNTSTNEVGGYLHLYPKDANSDEFGVEMVYEGLDDNFDVDESLQGGIIDDSTGSGTNVEDALENADEPKLDDLSGVEEFIGVVQAYGEEVENVSKGIGAFFGELPPWVIGSIGIGFGLLVVCGIIKALG